jgi:hypothetical protein
MSNKLTIHFDPAKEKCVVNNAHVRGCFAILNSNDYNSTPSHAAKLQRSQLR